MNKEQLLKEQFNEEMFERRIHLFVFVKVRKNWKEDPERYRMLGLDYKA
mgnify:CR=1 FL=1